MQPSKEIVAGRGKYRPLSFKKGFRKYWMLYAMMILPLAQYIIFRYCPLWGIQVAFKDYNLFRGIAGSKWAGFKYFNEAFATQQFWDALRNTVWLNLLDLIFGFPMPIILAIMLYEMRSVKIKRVYLDWLCEYNTIFNLQNGVEGLTYNLNEDGIPVLIPGVEGDMKFNSMQNLDYTLLVNGQWLDTDEKTMKAQALSYQGYANEYAAMYEVGNQDLIPQSFKIRAALPAEAQYNTTLKDFHREILVRCAMCKPEEVRSLFQQLVQEYLNRGGQAVMDERTAAWDLEHPAD